MHIATVRLKVSPCGSSVTTQNAMKNNQLYWFGKLTSIAAYLFTFLCHIVHWKNEINNSNVWKSSNSKMIKI